MISRGSSTGNEALVYDGIFADLVRSVMRAQLTILRLERAGKEIEDKHINQFFAWLQEEIPRGESRHLFDPDLLSDRASLRVKVEKKAEKRISSSGITEIRKLLKKRQSPVLNCEDPDDPGWLFVEFSPTRISSLIRHEHEFTSGNFRNDENELHLASPLAIVLDYLTAPELPGTREYALFSARNYLFRHFDTVPKLGNEDDGRNCFTEENIREALSVTWTSLRTRHDSRGQDKLPPYGAHGLRNVVGLVRAYLGMRRFLYLRFKKNEEKGVDAYEECEEFLKKERIPSGRKTGKGYYEYARSPLMEKLPEDGEVINELFGQLLPIRGATDIFRGGLKFPARGGLVMGVHGAAGAGKTSFSLGTCAFLKPMGVEFFYITVDEEPEDLRKRMMELVPEEVRRLHFFRFDEPEIRKFMRLERADDASSPSERIDDVIKGLSRLADKLKEKLESGKDDEGSEEEYFPIPKACAFVLVFDGLHDLFAAYDNEDATKAAEAIEKLHALIETFKRMKALVILTLGEDWVGDARIDYLVDVSLRLIHEATDEYGKKPHRRIHLTKARHQLCAPGVHGIQITGGKGLRCSPQINYRLDEKAVWKSILPDKDAFKIPFISAREKKANKDDFFNIPEEGGPKWVKVFRNSHIFINGEGSGGKAGLALRLAMAPTFGPKRKDEYESGIVALPVKEKILIVSFLYPEEYYGEIHGNINKKILNEYPLKGDKRLKSSAKVFHLYPGHLQPNDLFNRIDWELKAAELHGNPYTCVIIDGIHNVYLQFPAIEAYSLFWPQLYNALRSRPVTTITTHTTLVVPEELTGYRSVDDQRSIPLKHALVQKTDFQFEVTPVTQEMIDHVQGDDGTKKILESAKGKFIVRTLSCLGQPKPEGYVFWDREKMVFFEPEPEQSKDARQGDFGF